MLPGMLAAHLLRAARVRAGLTQAELARRAGTSQPVISAYEHGRRDPTVQTLARLLAAAGADLVLRAPEAARATSHLHAHPRSTAVASSTSSRW